MNIGLVLDCYAIHKGRMIIDGAVEAYLKALLISIEDIIRTKELLSRIESIHDVVLWDENFRTKEECQQCLNIIQCDIF